MTNNFTKGSPLKQILWFTLPFLIGNLFQQFYNIADMVIVGNTLGPIAYTAVGATGSVLWFASGAVQDLARGFSLAVARSFGAGDAREVKRYFAASIKMALYITVPLSLLVCIFCRPILVLLRTPDDLMARSYSYLIWVFAGLTATVFFHLLSNVIRALGDSRTPLYYLIVACLVNIALDYLFIAVLGMDTDGAGLATVLAQTIAAVCCAVYIVRRLPALRLTAEDFRHSGPCYPLLLRLGIPMAFLNMVLSVGSIVTQFVTNGLGTSFVTAQTTGAKIETFVTQPLLSLGAAVAVFAAQNYGAKEYERVVRGARTANLLGFAWCAIAALIMLPFGRTFVTLLAGNVSEEIIRNGYTYITINTLMVAFVSPLIIGKHILQSLDHTLSPMISGFTEIVGRAGVAILVMTLTDRAILPQAQGFLLLCFTNPAAWLCGLLTILCDYLLLLRRFRKLAKQPALAV